MPLPRRPPADAALDELRAAYNRALDEVGAEAVAALRAWPAREQGVTDARVLLHGARPRGARR